MRKKDQGTPPFIYRDWNNSSSIAASTGRERGGKRPLQTKSSKYVEWLLNNCKPLQCPQLNSVSSLYHKFELLSLQIFTYLIPLHHIKMWFNATYTVLTPLCQRPHWKNIFSRPLSHCVWVCQATICSHVAFSLVAFDFKNGCVLTGKSAAWIFHGINMVSGL